MRLCPLFALFVALLNGCAVEPPDPTEADLDLGLADAQVDSPDMAHVEIDMAGADMTPVDMAEPDAALPSCADLDPIDRTLSVVPLDVLILDRTGACAAADWTFEWVVTARPDGSTAQPTERFFHNAQPANGGMSDDPATSTAKLFVDLAGAWRLELWGQAPNGEPVVMETVAFWAGYWGALDIWHDHPGGPELQLILLHPDGDTWFSDPYACRVDNPTPDWGPRGPESDPRFFGRARSSTIRMDAMQDTEVLGAPYLLGVHWDGAGEPPMRSWVRIAISTTTVAEFTGALQVDAEFWYVAQVHWTPDGGWVEPIDEYISARRP